MAKKKIIFSYTSEYQTYHEMYAFHSLLYLSSKHNFKNQFHVFVTLI